MAARSLCSWACALSSCGEQGPLLDVCGLLTAMTSLVAEHRLQGVWTSVVVVHGLSCSEACGIFLDQGSNPYPPHW